MCKRPVLSVMPGIKYPHKDHPQSNIRPIFVFEMLNPQQTMSIQCSAVLAIHKAIGYVPEGHPLGTEINEADLLPIPPRA